MITVKTNDNSANYTVLFEEAFAFLAETYKDSKLEEYRKDRIKAFVEKQTAKAEANNMVPRFTSIQEYFAYIKDIHDLGGKKFLMLPLDEPVFEVDADKREITVPAVFKKNGISVKGDEIAESLIFKINRFFDYQDLNEMKVRVQWENADKEQGVSEIFAVDADRSADYLYLMWPLTHNITKSPGTIKFSLRFYTALEGGTLAYSWSTKIAAATINDGHNFNITGGDIAVDDASGLFANAINNSTTTASETAAQPGFIFNLNDHTGDPKSGIENADYQNDTVLEAYVDEENDTQTLRVQAYSTDAGLIGYEWFYIDTVKDDKSDTNGWSQALGGKMYFLESNLDYIETKDTTTPDPRKSYYEQVQDEDGEGVSYKRVNWADHVAVDGNKLYEKYSSTLVFNGHKGGPEAGAEKEVLPHVAGKYYAKAYNYVGDNSNSAQSLTIVFPEPEILEFAENGKLDKNVYLQSNGIGDIRVEAVIDARGAKASYEWQYAETKGAAGIDINKLPTEKRNKLSLNTEGNVLTVNGLPGYYKCIIVSTRNYAVKKKDPEYFCMVTEIPAEPTITYPLEDTAVSSRTKGAELKVIVENITGEFETEGMTYQWFKAGLSDDLDAPLADPSDKWLKNDDGTIYTVYTTPKNDTDSYYCVISNRIGEITSVTKSPVFSVGTFAMSSSNSAQG